MTSTAMSEKELQAVSESEQKTHEADDVIKKRVAKQKRKEKKIMKKEKKERKEKKKEKKR